MAQWRVRRSSLLGCGEAQWLVRRADTAPHGLSRMDKDIVKVGINDCSGNSVNVLSNKCMNERKNKLESVMEPPNL